MADEDLETIPVFAGLSSDERARIAAVARRLHWDPGLTVIKEGEFAFDFYAIRNGAAEVWQEGECVANLGSGDFFGELGVARLDSDRWSRRRTASVVITAPTDAVAIAGSDIRGLCDEIPKLRDALRAAAAQHRAADTR
jgi:CRP/FNR family transcriptional regulator, cyclic AMP receptor protein